MSVCNSLFYLFVLIVLLVVCLLVVTMLSSKLISTCFDLATFNKVKAEWS